MRDGRSLRMRIRWALLVYTSVSSSTGIRRSPLPEGALA